MKRELEILNRSVVVKVPGTCGEWIQTINGKRECLVSLPINRFTEMKISFKEKRAALKSQSDLMPKSQEAFHKICDYLKVSNTLKTQIHFEIGERLEIGKGMASSTADITAVMAGISALVGETLLSETLLKLACEIEPSDGVMFEELVLIDHLNGQVMEPFILKHTAKILMLKPVDTYMTEALRTGPEYLEKLRNKTDKPLNLLREGIFEQSLEKMGRASTLSLIENENILEKPFLGELIKIAEENHCYGLVGGHSGTVCGMLLNEEKTDLEKLLHRIEQESLGAYYASYEIVEMYNEGIQITVR